MYQNKPILITGSHRSGTTWVGQMIASSPSVAYIHEPFNIHTDPGFFSAPLKIMFTYVCEKNEDLYYNKMLNTLDFRYDLSSRLNTVPTPYHIGRTIKNYIKFTKHRIFSRNKRPLIKDPIAVFSAEWLSSRFNMDTVVMIRHPAAFVGSIKVMNWTFDFNNFKQQELLMEQHLAPFEDEIDRFMREERDIVDQGILLWNIIHHMILKYKKDHPDWIFARHEDLSRDAVNGFRDIFKELNLDYTDEVTKVIESHSAPKSTNKLKDSWKLQRDSVSNIKTWEKRLSKEEICRIKSQVHDISKEFYSEEDW